MQLDYPIKNVKNELDQISPTICLAKWLYVQIHLPSGLTQSCYHPPAHHIPLEELKKNPSALHNTKFKINERKQMAQGKQPPGCEYCWKIENLKNSKQISDRLYRSSENWAFENYDYVTDNDHDFDVSPAYLEVNFSYACNQKCIYCSPHLSSTWYKEIKEFGAFNLLAKKYNDERCTEVKPYNHNDLSGLEETGKLPFEIRKGGKLKKTENPYVQAFWKWFPEIYNDLYHLRMTGGEPLMHQDTYKVLNYVIENPSPELQLGITTNLCPSDKKTFVKFLKILKQLDNPVNDKTIKLWKKKKYLKTVTYFAKNNRLNDLPNKDSWPTWPRFIVEKQDKEIPSNIDSTIPRINRKKIVGVFDKNNENEKTGDFFYDLIWFKSLKNHSKFFKEWKCIGSSEVTKEGNSGVAVHKHLMLYVSLDSVGKQAEYIRYPLNFKILEKNVHSILKNLTRTSITFINTFNLLSVSSIQYFLEFINNLKNEYGSDKVTFDMPFLEYPNWLAIDILTKDFLQYMYDIEYKMKTVLTFSEKEIKQVERNIRYMEDTILGQELANEETIDLSVQRKNFALYIDQLDKRRNTKFLKIFPEYTEFYNLCSQI
jgi:organic radical activating enzyme